MRVRAAAAGVVVVTIMVIVVILVVRWRSTEEAGTVEGFPFYRISFNYSPMSGQVSVVDVDSVKVEPGPRPTRKENDRNWSFQATAFSPEGTKVFGYWANKPKESGLAGVPFEVMLPALPSGTVVVQDGDGSILLVVAYADLKKRS